MSNLNAIGLTWQIEPRIAEYSEMVEALASSDETPLAVAVRKFNEECSTHHVGKYQAPLTEDEIVASIRAWDGYSRLDDEGRAIFSAINKDRVFPPGSHFKCFDKCGKGNYEITVWWIDLHVVSGSRQGTLRIRDQKISSRRYSDQELARKMGGPDFCDQ